MGQDKKIFKLERGESITLPSGTTITRNQMPKNKPQCKYCGSLKLHAKCLSCGAS